MVILPLWCTVKAMQVCQVYNSMWIHNSVVLNSTCTNFPFRKFPTSSAFIQYLSVLFFVSSFHIYLNIKLYMTQSGRKNWKIFTRLFITCDLSCIAWNWLMNFVPFTCTLKCEWRWLADFNDLTISSTKYVKQFKSKNAHLIHKYHLFLP